MLKEELEKLREQINSMIISQDNCDEDIIRVSQELDILIINFMRKQRDAESPR